MHALTADTMDAPDAGAKPRHRAWPVTVARTLAPALGGFTLLNLAAARGEPAFHANLWWVDLRFVPRFMEEGLLAVFGLAAMGYAVRPVMGRRRRRITLMLFWLLGLAAISNATVFFTLLGWGRIDSGCPLPLSLAVVGLLGWIGWMARRPMAAPPRLHRGLAMICLMFSGLVFPVAQMVAFGMTDYRRPADAAVVFGCLAYPDGRCSAPLSERVRTACGLYHEGAVKQLIFSGGPTRGEINETDAMLNLARQLDVPESAIVCDPVGLNTASTVTNTVTLFERYQYNRVLAVSHFYHLPRIKLAYLRAGVQVYTVPAQRVWRRSRWLPYAMAREIAAWWWYYKQALVG